MDNNDEPDRVGALPVFPRGRDNGSDESPNSSSSGSTAPPPPIEQNSSTPQPPPPLEVRFYYAGFATEPPLVARTSTTPWRLQKAVKAMANVGTTHPLVALWPRVIDTLVAALTPLDWATIDLLRVGYRDTDDRTWPVTLLVAVEPGTVWERAYPVAVACRAVLHHHGIHDVECEVRESSFLYCAGRAGSNVDKLHTTAAITSLPSEERLFSELIGQPISPCHTADLEGSLSLYVQVGAAKDVYALTCRHVLLGAEESADQVSKAMGDDFVRHGVAQPGQSTFKFLEERASRRSPTRNANSSMQKLLTRQTITQSRVIGYLRYAPPRTTDQNKWLHDWALVWLYEARYANLPALQNWLWVDEDGYDAMMLCLSGAKKPQKQAGGDLVRLQGFVPVSEILRSTANDKPTQDEKALWVHCVGSAGGKRPRMTTGISNEVCSVRRLSPQSGSDAIITTRELCIVGRNAIGHRSFLRGIDSNTGELLPFSVAGDSGSAVFDSQGRVVGLLTGGVGRKQDVKQGTNNCSGYGDVSNVTPIEVILDAIRAKYGWVGIP